MTQAAPKPVRVERLADGPIVGPDTHPSIGRNIQGPSLIRVPDWLESPLALDVEAAEPPGMRERDRWRGRPEIALTRNLPPVARDRPPRMKRARYYLYFADHKGRYIRLAAADRLTGPWRVHRPGSLHLDDTPFPSEPPVASPEMLRAAEERMRGMRLAHSPLLEMTTSHIASPDVHVDDDARRIVMYYHGLESAGRQVSRAAVSADGVAFEALPEVLGRTYMRAFRYRGATYALAMPGRFYRSADGLRGFEEGPLLFNPNMRHSAVLVRGDTLFVFWTQVGDAPERILLSTVDLRGDWRNWRESPPVEVLRPERPWEGAEAPNEPSIRSVAYGMVNQLRDPAIYVEDDDIYLLYAVAGESGIAIAGVELPD